MASSRRLGGATSAQSDQEHLEVLRSLEVSKGITKEHGYILGDLTQAELELKKKCSSCGVPMERTNKRLNSGAPPQKRRRCRFHRASAPIVVGREGRGKLLGYPCCGGHEGSRPCSGAKLHKASIFPPDHLERSWRHYPTFGVTLAKDVRDAVVIYCETGTSTEHNPELIKVTMIDYFTSEVLVDKFVFPEVPMLHLDTSVTGITWRDLEYAQENSTFFFGRDEARYGCWNFVAPSTVVVGHAVHEAFTALRWIHKNVVDTELLEALCPQVKPQVEREQSDDDDSKDDETTADATKQADKSTNEAIKKGDDDDDTDWFEMAMKRHKQPAYNQSKHQILEVNQPEDQHFFILQSEDKQPEQKQLSIGQPEHKQLGNRQISFNLFKPKESHDGLLKGKRLEMNQPEYKRFEPKQSYNNQSKDKEPESKQLNIQQSEKMRLDNRQLIFQKYENTQSLNKQPVDKQSKDKQPQNKLSNFKQSESKHSSSKQSEAVQLHKNRSSHCKQPEDEPERVGYPVLRWLTHSRLGREPGSTPVEDAIASRDLARIAVQERIQAITNEKEKEKARKLDHELFRQRIEILEAMCDMPIKSITDEGTALDSWRVRPPPMGGCVLV